MDILGYIRLAKPYKLLININDKDMMITLKSKDHQQGTIIDFRMIEDAIGVDVIKIRIEEMKKAIKYKEDEEKYYFDFRSLLDILEVYPTKVFKHKISESIIGFNELGMLSRLVGEPQYWDSYPFPVKRDRISAKYRIIENVKNTDYFRKGSL